MGKLIVIEGLDGSGKATQTALLCDYLQQKGKPYRHITFPDYNDPSSALVKLYLSGSLGTLEEVNAYGASLFYAVDRYASYLAHWQQDYRQGRLIVADRYATSNVAHQMSKLPREEWDQYLDWLGDTEYLRVGIPRPDGVVYLDMEPETSRKLISSRYAGDETKRDIHEANFAYLLRCREAALYGAARQGWRVISCCRAGEPLPPDSIAQMVREALAEFLD